ncbi:MAG: hypothetical protein CMP38_02045 [Rickettsiales bacterium]|nr:hypothetical protein [Rickettsiales bacterium]
MRQDVLNFKFENKKDFYITSKNSLAINLIQKWPNWNNQFFFLYGPAKCGKTTICKIWQKRSKAIFLNKKKIEQFFNNSYKNEFNTHNNWILDNVDLFLKKKTDEKLLNFINIIKEQKKSFFLMTSNVPPRQLPTKINDLLSRVLDSLVVQVHEPDNILLAKIIKKYLQEREINIEKKKIDYLTNRIERSYKYAIKIAKKIDSRSLESHSNISFSFLKKILEI